MIRINQGYQSLFDYLVNEHFPLTEWINEFFYRGEAGRKRWNPHPHNYQQITGAFQPLADMIKDAVDTFKPYKTEYHITRDATQPLRGIGNFIRGILLFPCTPMVFIGVFIKDIFQATSVKDFAIRTGQNLVRSFSWLLDGVSSLIRGSTQIVFAPAAYIKLIFRCIISPFYDYPPIEGNSGIQKLFKAGKAETNPDKLDDIRRELHRKYVKSINGSQASNIPEDREKGLYMQKSGLYLNLFSLNKEEQAASLACTIDNSAAACKM